MTGPKFASGTVALPGTDPGSKVRGAISIIFDS